MINLHKSSSGPEVQDLLEIFFNLVRLGEDPETITGTLGMMRAYTLDTTPVYHKVPGTRVYTLIHS